MPEGCVVSARVNSSNSGRPSIRPLGGCLTNTAQPVDLEPLVSLLVSFAYVRRRSERAADGRLMGLADQRILMNCA